MKPPPLLLGAALLFWGWRVDLLWLGALCGALIELPHALNGRWDFSDKEFNRLWDVCTIVFIGAAIYLRYAEDLSSAAYKFFQWMPLIFFLMALGSVFSTRDGVPMKAFSWFLRRKRSERADRPIAFGWVYLVTCIVAAGASNERDPWLFWGLAGLTGWALWSMRPLRISDPAWCALFALIAGVAFLLQLRAQEFQNYLESKATEMLVYFGRKEFEPGISRTAMGSIGRLKQSSRIVMKVLPETGRFPERLREDALFRFDGTEWRGWMREWEPVPVEPDLSTWTILSNEQAQSSIRIIQRANRRHEFLALPPGTFQLRDLQVGEVRTNRNRAVRTHQNPGLLDFRALSTGQLFDVRPRREEIDWPEAEHKALVKVAEELALDDQLPDREKIEAVARFFSDKFRYTTFLEARARELHGGTPLSHFLLKTRAGHCEYFASATVLLLRYFNIPARYAIGYAVQEKSKEDESYIVRERHGHAWALAYLRDEDKWIEVDTTPPDWGALETTEFPFYQRLKDAFGRFTFGFLEWRWLGDWGFFRIAAPWLIGPLIGILAWRIFGRKMSVRKRPLRETQIWPGADSEFYTLEQKLAQAGLAREENESVEAWAVRLRKQAPALGELLGGIVRLHHRYRFDPLGLDLTERQRLRQMVQDCTSRL